jgi:hypothetical protein
MNYFPLGDLEEDRVKLSEKYQLLELVNGIYRLTQKCRDNYDEISYVKYLRGELSEPIKTGKEGIIASLLSM